jgi:exodeoxyribonuclease VII small subunit
MVEKEKKYEDLTLEQLLEKLNKILTSLEDEDLPLEKAVELFSEGAKINKISQKKIDALQQRVKIIRDDLKGNYEQEDFLKTDDE